MLGAGKGKGEFKSTIKEVMKKININKVSDNGKQYENDVRCEELTVYHPDQFIGKVKVRTYKKDRITEPIEGFLALDYLIIDEGRDLLTSNEPAYSESRRALRLGADGKEIYKKNVDAKLDEGLKYTSKCVFCIFVQPKPLGSDFVLDGDARRFAIAYVNLHGVYQDDARIRNITDSEVNEKDLIEDISEKFNHFTVPDKFTVSKDTKKTFKELYELLYQRGMSYSHKIADFTEINQFTMPNMLLKMAAVQALQKGSSIISPEHVKTAFVDYFEILEHTYEYIETRVMGSLNYHEKWQGAAGKDKEVLSWLLNEGATTKESSKVSIAEYKDKIMESFDVKDRQAGNILQKHRSNGWVESTQEQHSSKIWIAFIPDTRVAGVAGMHSGAHKNIQNKYYEIINKYEMKENEYSILQPCNHCIPEDTLKGLGTEINVIKKERKCTEYLVTAYENDITDMEREIIELSGTDDENISKLQTNIESYSKTLEKLKANMKKPVTIVNQPFSLIDRPKTMKEV